MTNNQIYALCLKICIINEMQSVDFYSNYQDRDYIELMPPELLDLWDGDVKTWATSIYHSNEYQLIEKEYISLSLQLHNEHLRINRGRLLKKISELCDRCK